MINAIANLDVDQLCSFDSEDLESMVFSVSDEFDYLGWELIHSVRDNGVSFVMSQTFYVLCAMASKDIPTVMTRPFASCVIDLCKHIRDNRRVLVSLTK